LLAAIVAFLLRIFRLNYLRRILRFAAVRFALRFAIGIFSDACSNIFDNTCAIVSRVGCFAAFQTREYSRHIVRHRFIAFQNQHVVRGVGRNVFSARHGKNRACIGRPIHQAGFVPLEFFHIHAARYDRHAADGKTAIHFFLDFAPLLIVHNFRAEQATFLVPNH
jgi:hypothetical protein